MRVLAINGGELHCPDRRTRFVYAVGDVVDLQLGLAGGPRERVEDAPKRGGELLVRDTGYKHVPGVKLQVHDRHGSQQRARPFLEEGPRQCSPPRTESGVTVIVRGASSANDGHRVGMGCQRPEITDVASEDRSARLGHSDDQGINGRSAPRRGAQHTGSASEVFGELFGDIADLEEPVRDGVVSQLSGEALNENHRRNYWRPDALTSEDHDQGGGIWAPPGQAGHASGVENQLRHDTRLASSARRTCRAAASALATAASSGSPTSATSSST
jgi:hypothetical protein